MQTLFSTAGLDPKVGFRRWREALTESVAPLEHTKVGDGAFNAALEGALVGGVPFTRITTSAVRSELTPAGVRRIDRDNLVVCHKLTGQAIVRQDGRDALHRPGEFLILDQRPTLVTPCPGDHQILIMEMPREPLERMLGSTRLYTALAIGTDQGSTALAAAFFQELVRVHQQLTAESAARMMGIGTDLIVASIAERLARGVPEPIHGTIVVQRAKSYVETHLGNPDLDPGQLAAAVGVSLRRLQELFCDRGQHISDWIWRRRVERAGERLADPAFSHMALGTLAYGCGFINQTHFSRRFKSRFGLSPSDYRQMARSGGRTPLVRT